ncbi:MAG TPA: DnaJ domain-containing protein [Archangium sp.]|jgi:tetratricopeptide (TPR) repeat protein|uniref:J domain-containing protein n=1 Tax=Archangium sp. TaxID=1872627 RepID=UPI002EDBA48B
MSQDPSPFHDKNPFEVLGLQGTEDAAAIRKAFLRIAAQSHPDRLRMKSEEQKAQALEIFLLAKKAFEVLSQPDKRREWSERLVRPTSAPAPQVPPRPHFGGAPLPSAAALQLHNLGMLALESSDYAKALDLFTKAAKLSPTPRHQAMESVSRGYQYLSTRFFDRARESFERALHILPECREAKVGLEALDKQSGRYLKGR